jgi:hypothetical protein
LSMSKNQRFRFVINPIISNTYQIQDSTGVGIKNPDNSVIPPTVLQNNVTFVTPPTSFTSKIVFSTEGVPFADSSSTALNTEAVIQLTLGGNNRYIRIKPETGGVTITTTP